MGPNFLKVFKEFHERGIVKKGLKSMKVFKEFHEICIINKGLRSSFILLCLKGRGLWSYLITDPMPDRVYKFLAQVLVRRLKEVLKDNIGESQRTCVEDRQILNGALIAKDLIHIKKKHKKLGILFKINMEKAYDYVDLNFVGYLFDKMGFGDCWKKWMKTCVEWTSYSFNSSPIDPIEANRCLRQGNPLSRFMFTLVVKV